MSTDELKTICQGIVLIIHQHILQKKNKLIRVNNDEDYEYISSLFRRKYNNILSGFLTNLRKIKEKSNNIEEFNSNLEKLIINEFKIMEPQLKKVISELLYIKLSSETNYTIYIDDMFNREDFSELIDTIPWLEETFSEIKDTLKNTKIKLGTRPSQTVRYYIIASITIFASLVYISIKYKNKK